MYKGLLKPLVDLMVSLLLIIVLLPVFLLITILLVATSQSSPFFVQERPGKNGRPFHIIKFRTMNNKTDMVGHLLPDSERLTGIGRWVRASSLDEIPQLINV